MDEGILLPAKSPVTAWPFRPTPLPDEILSSYLCRVACGHGMKPITFLSCVLGSRQNLLGQDIDSHAPERVTATIAAGAAVSEEAVRAMTIEALTGRLTASYPVNGRKTWVLPLNVVANDRRRPGLQYCPACLATDEAPYLRRTWRLAFATTCTMHAVELEERCPACAAVLQPHRSPSLQHCYRCGTGLAGEGTPADPAQVEWQTWLERTLRDGWCTMGDDYVWSHAAFAIARQVAALLVRGPHASAMRAAVAAINGGDPEGYGERSRREPFEYFGIAERRRLFDLVRRVMAGWPENLVQACSAAGMRRSHVIKDMPDPPFALDKILRERLCSDFYRAHPDEVAAAAAWLRQTRGKATYGALKAICGESRRAIYQNMDYLRHPSKPSHYNQTSDTVQGNEAPHSRKRVKNKT